MNVLGMAWRNVGRSRRRSFIAIAAMTFALWVLILLSSLFTGYMVGMENNILDLAYGDVQITAPAYQHDPSLYHRVDETGPLLAALDAAGFRAAPRLLGAGLAAAGESSAGVMLIGIDTTRDPSIGRLQEVVDAGRWLDPAVPNEVVIGRRLAKNLGVAPGSELVLLSQAADGGMANDLFRVRGVLLGISDASDRAGVFMVEAGLPPAIGRADRRAPESSCAGRRGRSSPPPPPRCAASPRACGSRAGASSCPSSPRCSTPRPARYGWPSS